MIMRRRTRPSFSPGPGRTGRNLRVEIDVRDEKLGYRIREAQVQRVPYMLVVGDKEAAEGAVAVRVRTGGDKGAMAVGKFKEELLAEVKERRT